MLADRTKRDDRFLDWKVRLFSVAAVAALAGIALEERWMVATAIVILAAAMLLRFIPDGDGVGPVDEDGDEDDDAGADPEGAAAE